MGRLHLLFLLLLPTLSLAQGRWNDLADVSIETRMDESEGYEISYPEFGPKVQALNGKEIELRGYMIPLESMLGQQYFVLSSLPFNICFFCGGAGPETIAEVHTKKPIEFTDDVIRVKGIFELNPDDPEHLMYIINEAIIIEE